MSFECNLVGPMKSNVSLNKELFTIFVDGGMLYSKGFTHFISIGDSDSFNGSHDHQLNKDKDRSDFYHALNLIPKVYKKVHANGFFGGRMDHFLMNLGEIDHFLRHNKKIIEIYDQEKLAISACSEDVLIAHIEGSFSLFSFEDNTICISGDCKYKTEMEYTKLVGRSSHGLSNIGYGKITIKSKGPIFLFYNPIV